MAHWWTFMTKKTKDIFVETLRHAPAQPRKGVFMDIQKNNSWTFMAHWWTFMTKKNKDVYDDTKLHAPAKPRKGFIYGHSKKIIHEHLWLIDGHFWRKKQTFMAHWWTFMTKKTQTFKTTKNRHSRQRKKHKHSRRQEKQEFYTNPTFSPSNCPIWPLNMPFTSLFSI